MHVFRAICQYQVLYDICWSTDNETQSPVYYTCVIITSVRTMEADWESRIYLYSHLPEGAITVRWEECLYGWEYVYMFTFSHNVCMHKRPVHLRVCIIYISMCAEGSKQHGCVCRLLIPIPLQSNKNSIQHPTIVLSVLLSQYRLLKRYAGHAAIHMPSDM